MTDRVVAQSGPRVGTIDRHSPAILLPLALLFGLVAQWLFYRTALGVNVGIAALVVLAVAWRIRPLGARMERLDRWIVPAAIVFSALSALRTDVMLLLFDVPVTLVLVTMAAVSFAGVPLTRRPLARRASGRIVSVGIGLALAVPFLVVFALLFSSADAVFSSALTNVFDFRKLSIGEFIARA